MWEDGNAETDNSNQAHNATDPNRPRNARIIDFSQVDVAQKYVGDTVTFQWDVQTEGTVYINDIPVPDGATSQQFTLQQAGVKRFKLTVDDYGDILTETLEVKVHPVPEFNLTQDVTKLRKGKGEHATIKWNIRNATSAVWRTSEQDVTVALDAYRRVAPEVSTAYLLVATGLDGIREFTQVVNVDVFPEAIVQFQADKLIVLPRGPITLSWDVQNADRIELTTFGPSTQVEPAGQLQVEFDDKALFNLREGVFTLTVTDKFDTRNHDITVRVFPLPLIRTLLVPMPHIEKNVKVALHLQRKNIQVNLHIDTFPVTVAKNPDVVQTGPFIPTGHFHKLAFGAQWLIINRGHTGWLHTIPYNVAKITHYIKSHISA